MLTPRALAVSLSFLALAVAGCKGKDDAPAPRTGAGSAPGSAVAGSAVASGQPVGSGSDLGSANPKAGDPITRPFFYKVEKDGKTSYLLGTWHVGIDGEKQLPKSVWDAFAAAKTFAMEADPADPAMLTAVMRTDGTTLEDELGPEHWAKLEAQLGKDADRVNKLKPAAAALLLQYKDLPQTMGMDLAFVTKAKAAQKQLAFLESAALQVELLHRWVDIRVLKQTIDDPDGTKRALADALAAYMIGDDATLAVMVIDRQQWTAAGYTEAEVDQFANEILVARNAAWIPNLEPLLAAGDAFVAVGAGHLVGAKSVVELLTAKGYTVTRVGA
jgi:uncharacterized protein